MLLDGRTAIVHGAGGAVGGAVARAYAREGARVYLAGRTEATLNQVAGQIRAEGGTATAHRLDVLDRAAVQQHADAVRSESGGVDVCFNATSNDDIQGTPLTEMSFEDVLRPVSKAVTAHFNVATAAGRQMIDNGGGAILVMGGGREAIPRLGGAHVAWAALAGLCRQLAADLGPYGVRVNWLLSPGSPDDKLPVPDPAGSLHPAGDGALPGGGLLPSHQPSYAEIANAAVFAASDWARTITASEINLTGGAVVD